MSGLDLDARTGALARWMSDRAQARYPGSWIAASVFTTERYMDDARQVLAAADIPALVGEVEHLRAALDLIAEVGCVPDSVRAAAALSGGGENQP